MALPTLTVTARIVAEPETRHTPNGTAVAKVRLVSNARRLNKNTNEWEDGDTWWGRATAFARTAEAIADANLQKGDLVTVRGRVKTDQWEDKDSGAKRSADELIIDDIARTIVPPRQQQGGGFGAPSAPQGGWQTARPQQGYDPAQHVGDPSMPPF